MNGPFRYTMPGYGDDWPGFDFEFVGSELARGQAPPWYQRETLDSHSGHVQWSGTTTYHYDHCGGDYDAWVAAAKAAAQANAILKARAESRYLLNYSGTIVAAGVVVDPPTEPFNNKPATFTAYATIQGTHLACNRLHSAYVSYARLMPIGSRSECGGHVHGGKIWRSNFKVRVPGAGDRLLWTQSTDQTPCPQRNNLRYTKLGETTSQCLHVGTNSRSEITGATFNYPNASGTPYRLTGRIHQFNTDGSVVFEVESTS